MDNYEKWGYSLLAFIAIIYLVMMFMSIVVVFPLGLLGLFVIVGVGLLMIKVIKERLANKEDDYYSKGVDQ